MSEIENVLTSMVETIKTERQQSASYQELAATESLDKLLRLAEQRMLAVALDLTQVLEDSYGIQVDEEVYMLLLSLPATRHDLATMARAEGRRDTTDAAFRSLVQIVKDGAR